MKKILSILLAALLGLGLATAAFAETVTPNPAGFSVEWPADRCVLTDIRPLGNGQVQPSVVPVAEDLVVFRTGGQAGQQLADCGRGNNSAVPVCCVDEDSVVLRYVEVSDLFVSLQRRHFSKRFARCRRVEELGGDEGEHYSQLPALLFGAVMEPTWRPS